MSLLEQHGELDYNCILNSLCSNTSRIAQRITMAGITDSTYYAGIVMWSKVRLGTQGSKRVLDALQNVRPYYGFEQALWFCFGHKSFLALLTETAAGFTCAAICASLAETYDLDRAAQLLQALWRTQKLPESIEPSRSQFRALASACSGVLVATPFSDIVRRLGTRPVTTGIALEHGHPQNTRCEDWAKAVNAIFRVANGELEAIRIYGGFDLAYLGAIAHWLFDLSIWVEWPHGIVTYPTCPSPELAKVQLHYADLQDSSALVHISGTTFVLRRVDSLILDDLQYSIYSRVPWRHCFATLFCEGVTDILHNVALLGRAAGAVARLCKALHDCEMDVGGLSRTHFTYFRPVDHGAGFIDNLCKLFPGISINTVFRTVAFDILKTGVARSSQVLTDSMETLQARCSCSTCHSTTNSSRSFSDGILPGASRKCNIVVFCFMRTIASTMAQMDLKVPINPSPSGLTQTYKICKKEWSGNESFLALATGLPHRAEGGKVLGDRVQLGNQENFLLDTTLRGVARLFMGEENPREFCRGPYPDSGPQYTALVKNGICMWIGGLSNITADPASIATIHVAPGQIVYKNSSYTSVWDLTHLHSEWPPVRLPPIDLFDLRVDSTRDDTVQTYYETRMRAEERVESGTIKLAYEFDSPNHGCLLQPGIITEEIISAAVRVPCPRGATCSDNLTMPCWRRRSGWSPVAIPDADVHTLQPTLGGPRYTRAGLIWSASSPPSKLLAIEGCRNRLLLLTTEYPSLATAFRTRQCMACMTRYIETFKEKHEWEVLLYYKHTGRTIDKPFAHLIHII